MSMKVTRNAFNATLSRLSLVRRVMIEASVIKLSCVEIRRARRLLARLSIGDLTSTAWLYVVETVEVCWRLSGQPAEVADRGSWLSPEQSHAASLRSV